MVNIIVQVQVGGKEKKSTSTMGDLNLSLSLWVELGHYTSEQLS